MDSDEAFVQAFLRGVLPPGGFHHRDHLRLAWWLVRHEREEEALAQVRASLRAWAATVGTGAGYNETLTRFWVRMVAYEVQHCPPNLDFPAFLLACPDLLDRHLPSRYWSQSVLWSEAARAAWVEPNLYPLACSDGVQEGDDGIIQDGQEA